MTTSKKTKAPQVLVKEVTPKVNRRFEVDFTLPAKIDNEAAEELACDGQSIGKAEIRVNEEVVFILASCGEKYYLSKKAFLALAEAIK